MLRSKPGIPIVYDFGDSQVCQFRTSIFIKHNIVRFDVTVNHFFFIGGNQCRSNLSDNLYCTDRRN